MALEAVAWTGLTYKTLNLKPDFILIALSFAFTWVFYTLDRLNISQADWTNNPERSAWYASQPFLKKLIWIVSILVTIVLPFRLHIFLPVLIGIIPCLLYTTEFKIGSKSYTLKSLPVMKVILVAFLWVLLTVLFPVFSTDSILPPSSIIFNLGMMIACFIMLQIHTNDVRDIKGDTHAQIKSFAVLLGDKTARLFGLALIGLGIYFGWHLFNTSNLLIFSTFLALRTVFYTKAEDIYWQALITSQGVLAYFILYFIGNG